jgi:oligogalacturonide transport system substrate-binding protein
MREIIKPLLILTILLITNIASAQETTLRFGWWGADSRHKPTLQVISLFEKKNPGVKIQPEYMGFNGYLERLTTQISAGNEPDIMQVNWAWISAMFSINGNGFYDLYKTKDYIRLEQFGMHISAGIVHGKLNGIPVSMSARFFLWQKTTFDKAGIPLPSTWEELIAAGKVFETKLGSDYYPIDGNLYDLILMAHTYLVQKTGKHWIDPRTHHVLLNKAEALEFVNIFKRLTLSHAAVPLKLRLKAGASETPVDQLNEWVKGTWAGTFTWDSTFRTRMSTLPFSTSAEVGPFLTIPGANKSGMFYRPALMYTVSKNSRNPHIAAQFIDYMLNDPEAIMVLSDSRGIPITNIGMKTLEFMGKISPFDRTALSQMQALNPEIFSPYFEHSKIQEFMRSVFTDISNGNITDEQAAVRLTDEANKILISIIPASFTPEPEANNNSDAVYEDFVGIIHSISEKEVTLSGLSSSKLFIGDILYAENGGNPITLKVTYPMLGSAKCIPQAGPKKDLKPGMKIYRKYSVKK